MENFLNTDIDTFVKLKLIKVFEKLNGIEIDENEFYLEKIKLSGISNTIFKIKLHQKNQNKKLAVDSIFFKVFGLISALVDRELETTIMEKLYLIGRGSKIYDTDLRTYRVEEYIPNCKTLKREIMLDDRVLPKMINIFSTLNTLEEYQYYFSYVGNSKKNVFFEKLKVDKKTNLVNFCLNKIKPFAQEKFLKFKEKYLQDDKPNFVSENEENFKTVEYYLENLDEIFYKLFPEQGIFVITHNDAHPLNILTSYDYQKIYLLDYEYATYNLIGFDISNYLIETYFYLEDDDFPFYQIFSKKYFSELKEDKYFNIYLKFMDNFEQENGSLFESLENYKELFEKSRTRDYYYRLIGLSALLWFGFGVIYYDYDSIKSKTGYDYFNFSLDRLNIYDKFIKKEIN